MLSVPTEVHLDVTDTQLAYAEKQLDALIAMAREDNMRSPTLGLVIEHMYYYVTELKTSRGQTRYSVLDV